MSSVPKSLKRLFESDSQDYVDNYAKLKADEVKEAKKVIKQTLSKYIPVDLFGLYYSEELIKWKRGESNLAHVLYGVFDEKHTNDILKSFSYRVEAPVLVFNDMGSPMISNIGAVYHLRALWGQMLLIFPDLTPENANDWVNNYNSGFSAGWAGLRDLFGHLGSNPRLSDDNLLLSIPGLQGVSDDIRNGVIEVAISYVQEPELVQACIERLVKPIGV